MLFLNHKTQRELRSIALCNVEEQVGLIDPLGNILRLTNLHEEPRSNFEVSKSDISRALSSLPDGVEAMDCTLWHTHPGGGVGPSRSDLRNKTPFNYHLVVSVIEDDIKLTWY